MTSGGPVRTHNWVLKSRSVLDFDLEGMLSWTCSGCGFSTRSGGTPYDEAGFVRAATPHGDRFVTLEASVDLPHGLGVDLPSLPADCDDAAVQLVMTE